MQPPIHHPHTVHGSEMIRGRLNNLYHELLFCVFLIEMIDYFLRSDNLWAIAGNEHVEVVYIFIRMIAKLWISLLFRILFHKAKIL